MAEVVLIGAIAASAGFLFLVYQQVSGMEERLRHMVETTEQRLVDTWTELKYQRPDGAAASSAKDDGKKCR